MSSGNALLHAAAILEALDLAPGQHVADLAAGRTGHFVFGAAEAVGSEGRVYAVDLLRDALSALEGRRALRGAENVYTVWGDVEREGGVAIPEQSLDVALLVHALGWMREQEAAVRATRRLMKPGGRVVVIDWQNGARHPLAALARAGSPDTTDVLFSHVGYTKTGEFSPSPWHWGRVYAS